MNEYGMDDALYAVLLAGCKGAHPERYILGKPHPDRAKQFKPFAALRGYDETVKQMALNTVEEERMERPYQDGFDYPTGEA